MNINVIFANILGGLKFTGTTYGEINFGGNVLDQYIDIFKTHKPDILALAEVHLDDENTSQQVAEIAEKLGLPHYDVQGADKSHLVEGKILGNAVLSRFPIIKSDHFLIKAPALEVDRPNGDHWVLHDKGAQTVQMDIGGRTLSLSNLQYFPFHHFLRQGNDPAFAPERQMLVEHLTKEQGDAISVVTGDFNNKGFTLKEAFPELFEAGFSEAIEVETTIVGDAQQLDHILYKNDQANVVNAEIVNIPSDHLGLRSTIAVLR